MERRTTDRVRCRIACEIAYARKPIEALVLDMSEGGLSVRSPKESSQGDAISLGLRTPQGPIAVEAIVWHSRAARERHSKAEVWLLGLIISRADPAYYQLLPGSSDPEPEEKPAEDHMSEQREPPYCSSDRPEPVREAEPTPQATAECSRTDDQQSEEKPAADTTSEQGQQLPCFRIQLKQRGGPRTRVLSLNSISGAEARSLAADELGADWEVLRVWEA